MLGCAMERHDLDHGRQLGCESIPVNATESLFVADVMGNQVTRMRMPPQPLAQLFDMRDVKDLRGRHIAEINAVIPITHRMPFETGKGHELTRLVRRIGRL